MQSEVPSCSEDSRGDSGRSLLSARAGDNSSLDFTVAPIYSSTTNFGVALNCQLSYGVPKISGRYGSKPSSLSLYASGSINGYYRLMLNGINRLNNSRDILSYGAEAGSLPTRLWGLSYDDSMLGNYHSYTEKTLSAWNSGVRIPLSSDAFLAALESAPFGKRGGRPLAHLCGPDRVFRHADPSRRVLPVLLPGPEAQLPAVV